MDEDQKNELKVADSEAEHEEAEPLVKAKAILYLATGLMVVFTPWLLLIFSYLGKSVPLFEQIMYFCAAIVAGILGISPWALEVFKKK